MPSIHAAERELPLIQRAIVDNCFEEGHYESGIGVLDKLRGQRYKPSPQHIRQLLYISLYPLPPKPPKYVGRVDAPPPSPQKIQLQRQKDDLWPKPASRPLAIALLEAFAKTNTPESLMRGLPFHSYVDNDGIMDVNPFRREKPTDEHAEDHSPIRNELLAIQELKDCWGLLRNGFVKRKQADRYRMDEATVNPESEDDDVVGPYAWPVLEWLVNVFEQDEKRAGQEGQAPYSALLLCQIPAPRSRKGPRWDAEMPLQVAYACMSTHSRKTDRSQKYASSEMRIDLGMRLISLLLNLTSTKPPLIVPSDFLRLMVQRLFHLPLPSLEAFLSVIPLKHISFKVSLLERYISQGNGTSDNNKRPTGTSMAPVPRAKPKFTGKGIVEKALVPTAASSPDKEPFPMPMLDHLLTLISSPLSSAMVNCRDSSPATPPPPPTAFATRIALAKFHLVSALCTLHLSRGLADPQWAAAVGQGKLRKHVLDGFTLRDKAYLKDNTATNNATQQTMDSEREIEGCLASALEMISLWEASGEGGKNDILTLR